MSDITNSERLVVGIDPGQSGAVVALGRGVFRVWRNFKTLSDIAFAVNEAGSLKPDKIVIEFVRSMPGQGVCSVFSFGRSTGVAMGAVYASLANLARVETPFEEVAPIKWMNWVKKQYSLEHLGAGQFDSREVFLQAFPEHVEKVRKPRGKLCDGATDAAFIALWGQQN